ncbi:hypothetical protein [Streptomyces sp. NEAU-W12]|uniref:hypothetical protein n=1 Tax=Streptomyces sp. NEAU-W12 TaxID=2994668 RepID=UPI00224B50AF|nr:hypothetical protein [Streptomyces sp. NEAU-W12]MCX2925448.1 hypothetical protein [Streptomyces sp. NEAU-W12]
MGPHTTGTTTAVRGALFAAKEGRARHGADFPAHSRHPAEAVLAACARPATTGDTAPTGRHWQRLLDRVRATGERTSVISSEFLADAEGGTAPARIVERPGGDRLHVLVTLRSLTRVVPPQRQQCVRNGLRTEYEQWLEHVFRRPPYGSPSSWRRHRQDRLVERWAGATGPDRVTVVVVDDRDRDALVRAFEALLGLPAGVLRPVPETANRSPTLAETEMLRNLDKEFRGNDLPEELYSRLVRHGAVARMKNACSPTPQDVKIRTPQWALEAAAGSGAGAAARIGGMGVRVLGDLETLSRVPEVRGAGGRAAARSRSGRADPVRIARRGHRGERRRQGA